MRRAYRTTCTLAAALAVGLVSTEAAATSFPREVMRGETGCTLFLDMHGDVQEQCPGKPVRPLLRKSERRDVPGWPRVVRRGDDACLQYVGPEGALRERCPESEQRMLEGRWMRRVLREAAPAGGRPGAPAAEAYGVPGTWDADLLLTFASQPFTDRYSGAGRMQFLEVDAGAGRFVASGLRLWVATGMTFLWGDMDLVGVEGVSEESLRASAGALLLLGGPRSLPRVWPDLFAGLGPFLSAGLEMSTSLDNNGGLRPGGTLAAGLRGPLVAGLGGDLRVGLRFMRLPSDEVVRVWEVRMGVFGFALP